MRLCTRLGNIASVAPNLCGNQRLQRFVQSCLPSTQRSVGEPPKGHVSSASGKNADPRVAGRTDPVRTAIVAMGIIRFTEANECGLGAADRLR